MLQVINLYISIYKLLEKKKYLSDPPILQYFFFFTFIIHFFVRRIHETLSPLCILIRLKFLNILQKGKYSVTSVKELYPFRKSVH